MAFPVRTVAVTSLILGHKIKESQCPEWPFLFAHINEAEFFEMLDSGEVSMP